jgi:geranylgeranyl pyrophosphate synthase
MVYEEAPALLVGDALLTEAFAVLSELPLDPKIVVSLVYELATAAGQRGMVGGQAGDIGMAGEIRDLDSLVRVHGGKTGALICAAVRMGAIAAGAKEGSMLAITAYGRDIGLAFQMADDLLDAEEDAGEDGPPSYVKVLGERETRDRAIKLLNNALKAISTLPRPNALAALARFSIERSH